MKNYDWIIIGGGIAGISIAEYISRTNKNILLIEKTLNYVRKQLLSFMNGLTQALYIL